MHKVEVRVFCIRVMLRFASEMSLRSLMYSRVGIWEGDWITKEYTHQLVNPLMSSWLNLLLGSGTWLEKAVHWE